MGGSLMGTMATGMAFGAGSEIAHQGVRAMMGGGGGGHGGEVQQQAAGAPPQQYAEPQQQMMAQPQEQQNPCAVFNQSLLQCLQTNSNDIA